MKVFLIAAMTVDGFISRNNQEFIDWTSKEDKKFFINMTKKSGVMVMGGNTFRTFKEPLPGRRHIVYTRSNIEDQAFEKTNEEPKDLIDRLSREGLNEVAIIGGSTIYSMFLAADVVTDVYLTIEPLLFGGGVKMLSEKTDLKLSLNSYEKLNNNTLLVHYKVGNGDIN